MLPARCDKVHGSQKKKDPQEYVVYGAWESKEAWEGANLTAGFKTQFKNPPVEQHTLSSASFFEVDLFAAAPSSCRALFSSIEGIRCMHILTHG
jgi:hypothetical protein